MKPSADPYISGVLIGGIRGLGLQRGPCSSWWRRSLQGIQIWNFGTTSDTSIRDDGVRSEGKHMNEVETFIYI